MSEQSEYITSLWNGCRRPVKQVQLIAELSGTDVRTVLKVLKSAGKIPRAVTEANYKDKLVEQPVQISYEMQRYIIGSMKMSQTLARELRLPLETVLEIRQKAKEQAMRKGKRNGRRTAEKS